MSKLNFSGNLPKTITNNILKPPMIPAGAFSIIQDGVQYGCQNFTTAIQTTYHLTSKKYDKRFLDGFLS